MKKIALAASIALASSVTANAADLVVAPVEPVATGVPTYNWSGFYIGLGGGTGNSVTGIGIPPLAGAEFDGVGGWGFFGEATVGYDHMFANRWVLGAYATARYGTVGPSLDMPGFGLSADATADYGFDAIARLGYAITPGTLAYVLGGYSWQHFDISTSPNVFSYDWSSNGWVVGLGVEAVLSNRFTIKSEYRYSNYGTYNPAGPLLNVDTATHTFHTSLVYRFNGGYTGPMIEPVEYNWTGLNLGAAVGAGVVQHDTSVLGGFASLDGISGQGFQGDLTLGYDYQFANNWVAGVVLGARYSGISTDASVGPYSASVAADYGFDALARIGYTFGPTLAYVVGGYSWQHFDISTTPGVFSYDWGANGATIGTGVEAAFNSRLTGFLEYRYTFYDSENFNSGGLVEVQPADHTVRVGLKYKLF